MAGVLNFTNNHVDVFKDDGRAPLILFLFMFRKVHDIRFSRSARHAGYCSATAVNELRGAKICNEE